MSTRFRKSASLGKGVKLNVSKSSVGVSFGGKHGGVSLNSKNGARARVSAPGTGFSYSQKLGGSNKASTFSNAKIKDVSYSRSESDNISVQAAEVAKAPVYPKASRVLSFAVSVVCGLLCFMFFAIKNYGIGIVALAAGIGCGLICDYYGKHIDAANGEPAPKKPIYKRAWVIVLAACAVLGFLLGLAG